MSPDYIIIQRKFANSHSVNMQIQENAVANIFHCLVFRSLGQKTLMKGIVQNLKSLNSSTEVARE